jgi:hypothetical protein
MAQMLWFVQCASMGESSHLLGLFETEAEAKAFLAKPHNEKACPRNWMYQDTEQCMAMATPMGGKWSPAWKEFTASALTGEGVCPADATVEEEHHELEVGSITLLGARVPGEKNVWYVLAACIIGEMFNSAAAFTTRAAALKHMGLKPTDKPSNEPGGKESPFDEPTFHGEGCFRMRSYPVTGW